MIYICILIQYISNRKTPAPGNKKDGEIAVTLKHLSNY